jgi:histone deacetylase 1/2
MLWMKSMDEELQELHDKGAYEFVPRSEAIRAKEQVVKSTWAFRRKRKPDGSLSRYKSRLCVRGDLQRGKYTTNETFAPVVDWSTVRMLFTLALVNNWESASIDFKNAFVQAQLPSPIYLELPPGYQRNNPKLLDHVMKIKTSLYGDRRAANLWYNKLRTELLSKHFNFKCSVFDPCLFIRDDCMLVVYVDDAIVFARDDKVVAAVLKKLGDRGFDYSRDGDFNSYLGVQIDDLPNGTKKLSQPGLTNQLLDVMGLTDANACRTPVSGPLFQCKDSEPFDASFNYRSALGMLMYLANNTRPEISFAVNACAQYSVAPKEPHGAAVKRICRSLKGTTTEGLHVKPNAAKLSLDCYVDADYAGNWTRSEADDAVSVRSRTGFIILFGEVPVLWKSRRQDLICLSTMESEYVALSTAMRSLVHIRALLFEMEDGFGLKLGDRLSTISTVFEDNRAAKILATTDPPRLTPRSKSLAVKYHWFRSMLSPTTIVVEDVASALNMADIFTKSLAFAAFIAARQSVCGW